MCLNWCTFYICTLFNKLTVIIFLFKKHALVTKCKFNTSIRCITYFNACMLFFSQATSIDEVDDEIFFFMQTLGDFELTMPIVLDWEYISDTARTANVDAETLTAMQKHFCETMVNFGYNPMVYFNWHLSENSLYLSELEDYPFWLALYQDRMTYPFRVEMWQYTCTGRVPGIQGDVDINVYMPDATKAQ